MNIKKRLIKSPKIYIRDAGLLHTLLRNQTFDDLQGDPCIGKSWEGFVIEQKSAFIPEYLKMACIFLQYKCRR